MSSTPPQRLDFVPDASIVAFVFIGVVVLVGLIARCLALNNSTIRSSQSLDLMIYREAPRPAPALKARYPSNEPQFDSHSENRDGKISLDDSVTPTRIQRGPKNL